MCGRLRSQRFQDGCGKDVALTGRFPYAASAAASLRS